jgi:bla regulator protein BlaR1
MREMREETDKLRGLHRCLVWVILSSLLAAVGGFPVRLLGQVLHPVDPMPAFEVATIKPADATERFSAPMENTILFAFGLSGSSTDRLIGAPDWVKSKRYALHTKAPDAIRDAMEKMTAVDRTRETRLMQQSLLAGRLKLKVHFETRVMPTYELVLAKSGTKLKEADASQRGGMVLHFTDQKHNLKGNAVPVQAIVNLLMADPEIGGRTVVDKTGLTGNYDVVMDWVPGSAAAGTDGPSLFAALEEQLGLKLVATKGPVEVVVIDHIEMPSEN